MELWFEIQGFGGIYFVNKEGKVKSIARKVKNKHSYRIKSTKILKPIKDSKGYLYYNLYKDSGKVVKRKYAHRLVAECFLSRVEGKNFVNHINEVKTNNNVDNLEWVTHKENMNHGTRNKRLSEIQIKKPVSVFDLEGNFVGDYESINECCRKLKIDLGNVSKVLKGVYRQTKGYVVIYT